MDDELWAHSVNGRGIRHLLADHLRGTAALARTFGDAFGAGELAGYLGLTHDVGKSECGWQQGLLAVDGTHGSVGIDHSSVGSTMAITISTPPIVGVPVFFRCDCGPSSRTNWPI